ncbi:MAG TPA: hydroxymethylglutaryl-CoA lyase [Cryomorphaceae bacterium]|nr:hydroxymethylglutaryl-CoA lyase [Cryomorphaceae bacterium]
MEDRLIWVECPRDAMQGYPTVFKTEDKVEYLRHLLEVGYDTIDIGSFVSPKAIPQMADTANVLEALAPHKGQNRFLVIAANPQGVQQAAQHPLVDVVGFPFSASDTFQQRNTRRTQAQALEELTVHAGTLRTFGKSLVVYVSMAFGNPYGEPYEVEEVAQWVKTIEDAVAPEAISLSDTVAMATPELIEQLVQACQAKSPKSQLGLHLHVPAGYTLRSGLVQAGWTSGVRRFDSALLGFGGCPMAQDQMCGNLPSESLLTFALSWRISTGVNPLALEAAHNAARRFFL